MWLIPRLEAFQRGHPDIDIRIDASDALVDLDTADIDLALRYAAPSAMPARAEGLLGEQLAVVASPWLLKGGAWLDQPADLTAFTLIEASDHYSHLHMDWLSWQRWIGEHHPTRFEPRRWLYFNYANQIAQAALTGQGVALARLPLVADSLASGDLVELLPATRLDTPLAYWLMVDQQSRDRSEVVAFCDWLRVQAQVTRETIGEVPDPDLRDDLDWAKLTRPLSVGSHCLQPARSRFLRQCKFSRLRSATPPRCRSRSHRAAGHATPAPARRRSLL